MSAEPPAMPAGTADLLNPPPELAEAWRAHGTRARRAIALAADETETEAELCYNLTQRLWYTVSSWPFVQLPVYVTKDGSREPEQVMAAPPDVIALETWLWTVVHGLKARALTLDPDLPWPPPSRSTPA